MKSTLLSFSIKLAAEDAVSEASVPSEMVSITAPPGMEWDWPGQENEFQHLARTLRPDLSGHFVRGHGGGSTGSFVVRPRHRLSDDPADLKENAKNTRSLFDILQSAKRTHGGIPDCVFLGQCNKQHADLPLAVENAMGGMPGRLVYASPGAYNNTGVSREALKYVLKENRPWFLPKEKEFAEGHARVRGLLQPLVPSSVSVPALTGGLSMLANELVQRHRGKKNSWWRRAAFGAGGAAAGALAMAMLKAHNRRAAFDKSYIPNYVGENNAEDAPLVTPLV